MANEVLILNFEGADGAPSWTEEAQGLEPAIHDNCELDTAQHYAGNSSLLFKGGSAAEVSYLVPGINSSNVDLTFYIALHEKESSSLTLMLTDADGGWNSTIYFQLFSSSLVVQAWAADGTRILYHSAAQSWDLDTWYKFRVTITGTAVAFSLNDALFASDDTGKPLTGLDSFAIGWTTWVSWLDAVTMGSVPAGGIDIPVAAMELVAQAPSYGGSGYAEIPVALLRLLARNPSCVWSIPLSRQASSQVVCRCILTGADDGLADIDLPIASFQARLRDGEPSYLSCVVPNSLAYAGEVASRPNGEIIVLKGLRLWDGTEHLQEIARVNYESVQIDRGARNDSLTLSGHKTVTSSAVKEWTVAGVSFYGLQTDGKRSIRADVDLFLRPGDTCIYGSGGNDYFVAGQITIWVTARPAAFYMEVTEA